MSNFDDYKGKLISGRYRIEDVVGVGGMAYVLKAQDEQTGRTVAMKILSEKYNDDRNTVKRFINESKAISMLHHKNIVSVYDVSITEELKYIVMEYIDGVTLKDYIFRKAVLNWKEAVTYTIQILEGLCHAHGKGIIHRDIKPQNILLGVNGSVKVTDFGIAKIATNESLTITDKAIGTVDYISPEQASADKVTASSDLYSVGVMLYEMVTGSLPFVSDNPVAVATMHVSSVPAPPREKNPSIPVGLEQIILKVMSKKCENRFSGAESMIKALKCLLENPDTVFYSRATSVENENQVENKAVIKTKKQPDIAAKNKTGKGSRSMFPIVSGFALAFVIVCIVAGISAIRILDARNTKDYSSIKDKNEKKLWEIIDSVFIGSNGTGTEIKIPSLLGLEYNSELEKELEKYNFRISNVKYASEKNKPIGSIVAQSPEPNSIRKISNSDDFYDITVTVNKMTDTVEIPNLALMSYNAARAMLIDMGISRNAIIKEEKFDDSVVEGFVISTNPLSGETFDATGSESITIYVSAGQQTETTTVPELVGMSVEAAKRALIERKLAVGSVTYEDSAMERGTVLRAGMETDTIVPAKITKVDLYVSRGNLSAEQDPNFFNEEVNNYEIDGNGNFVFVPEAEEEQNQEDAGFYIDENGNLVYRESSENQEASSDINGGGTESSVTGNVNQENPSENSNSEQNGNSAENQENNGAVQESNPHEITLEDLRDLLG